MPTVKAYYDGTAFVPAEPFSMPKGEFVKLSVTPEEAPDPKTAEKLEAFDRITAGIREINKTDPLPPEFDAISAKRMNFTGGTNQ
jgi:hypothetical protein